MVERQKTQPPQTVSIVDEHGFILRKPSFEEERADPFSPKKPFHDNMEFEEIPWDDGTITTSGTSRQSMPRIVPVKTDSFAENSNPFGYGEEINTRREPSTRSSRSRRRASLSGTGMPSADINQSERRARRSRRSSLSYGNSYNSSRHIAFSNTPPLFEGEDILSSTTIDQGNGNKVCVVVIQLEGNEGYQPDNEPRKHSERSNLGRRSSERRDSGRRSSERRNSDRPRRRSSVSHGDGSTRSSEESSSRKDAERVRRRTSISHGKGNEEKGSRRDFDRPRRRSSITNTDITNESDERGSRGASSHSCDSSKRSSRNLGGESTHSREENSRHPREQKQHSPRKPSQEKDHGRHSSPRRLTRKTSS